MLVHGELDNDVAVQQPSALRDQVGRVEILPGVDHFDVIDPRHWSWQIVLDEIDELRQV